MSEQIHAPRRPGDLLRRSFRLSGHKTSISMERAFWDELGKITRKQNRTITDILDEIDRQREDPLSRAARLYVLEIACIKNDGRG